MAGLSAIGTSKAMGSVVRAWDVRDVSDQAGVMGWGGQARYVVWSSISWGDDVDGVLGYFFLMILVNE